MDDAQGIVLEFSSRQKGRVTLTARCNGEVLAVDTLDIRSASARKKFIAQLTTDRAGIDAKVVEAELLRLAGDESGDGNARETKQSGELDVSHIVRPELFHTQAVSGIAVPSARLSGGKPCGEWALYLRWHADGRRERRELSQYIELPDGERIWIFPQTGAPTPTMRAGWSVTARGAWLDDSVAPDPVAVFRAVCERIAYYLDFPPDIAPGVTAMLACWVMLTYVYVAWPSVPYLSVGEPTASGKTQLFRVLALLVLRPLESSNMTAACLFRTLHECGGVLLLNEAERLGDGSPEAGYLRSILLSGYKRGSPASRLEKVGDGFKRVEFEVYGPKALAAIARLPDTLANRCIRVTMFRAEPNSPKPRRRLSAPPTPWAVLRDELHAIALEYGPTWIELSARADICPAAFGGREFELWQLILALAAWLDELGADGLLAVVSGFAERTIESGRDDTIPEADEAVLRILAGHVQAGTHTTLRAGNILNATCEADPTTFGPKDKPRWSAKGVSSALGRYRLRTGKRGGKKTYHGVTIPELQRIERAYGFDLGLTSSNVPDVPQCTPTPPPGAVFNAF